MILLVMLVVTTASANAGPGRNGAAADRATEIRVGSELEFPPYAFVDEKGLPAGFSVELIKAVADAMGLQISFAAGPWDRVWNDLVARRIDVLPIVAKMPERRGLVDFSLPHTETFDAFFVRAGSPQLRSVEEARGKELVVMRSDAAHHALLERGFRDNLVFVDTIPEGLALIAAGRHDAFLCSKLIGTLAVTRRGLRDLAAGPPIPDYKRVFSFAVKKGDSELLEKLNQGLLIIKTNGEYDRIYEKWLTFDDPWRMVKKYLPAAVIVVIVIALAAGVWSALLQRLVRKRTRELAESNEQLRKSQEEVQELNRDLERRVADRTAELEAANRDLDAFAHSVSHDLRAPLRAIDGFSRALLDDCSDRLDAAGKDYLGRVCEASGRMAQLIHALLSMSKCTRVEMNCAPVDLSRLAKAVADELKRSRPARPVEFLIADNVVAPGDTVMLRAVVENLLENAWKFTGKRSPATIEFGTTRKDGHEVYFVRDNGDGFSMEYADRLFLPFRRLHRESDFPGIGIGLATVKRIIERHGGRIWAEAEPGKGATFSFTVG
jgi:signal transduction histidine kinase